MQMPFLSFLKKTKRTFLIRNIDEDTVDTLLSELQDNGMLVVNVLPKTVMLGKGNNVNLVTNYDILVSGHDNPFWQMTISNS